MVDIRCVDVTDDEIDEIIKIYKSGKPIFPEKEIRLVERQLQHGLKRLKITDMRGQVSTVHIDTDQPAILFIPISELLSDHRHVPSGFGPFNSFIVGPVHRCPSCIDPNPFATTAECDDILQQAEDAFKGSETRKKILQKLGDFAFSASIESPKLVTKIVAFGLGTLERSGDLTNAIQHILVLAIKRFLDGSLALAPNDPDTITCYAQDPAYTKADKAALRKKGIQVLPRNEGLFKLDDQTIVVSGGPENYPLEDLVAERARPVMFLTARPGLDMDPKYDCEPRVVKLFDQYRSWRAGLDQLFHGDYRLFVRHLPQTAWWETSEDEDDSDCLDRCDSSDEEASHDDETTDEASEDASAVTSTSKLLIPGHNLILR